MESKTCLVICFLMIVLDLMGSRSTSRAANIGKLADRCDPDTTEPIARIGGVIDYSTRMGKEQKIAMEMAVQDIYHSTCDKFDLLLQDSQGIPARAAASST